MGSATAIIDGNARLRASAGLAAAHQLLADMDRLHIASAVVAGGGYIKPERLAFHVAHGGGCDVDIDNGLLLAQCAVAPERLLPVYIANPHRGPERYRQGGRDFRALKLAPVLHGVPLRDSRMVALIDAAAELEHAVYLHCLHRPGFEVTELVALAESRPSTRFVLEHAGVGNCDFYAVSLIAPHPNIYLETSGGFSSVARAACEQLGSERVIFGSEYPLQDPRVELEKMRCLGLNPRELSRVLADNTRVLMGLGEAQ